MAARGQQEKANDITMQVRPAQIGPADDNERQLTDAVVQQALDARSVRGQSSAVAGRQRLPRWVPVAMRLLAQSLLIVAVLNLLLGLLSMVYPLLVRAFGAAAMQPIWSFYSTICPQRPSHTWFIGDLPMAMEQRMVSMYVAFGVAGLLYCARGRRPLASIGARLPVVLCQPLPLWLAVLGVAPACIDVAISTAGILPSTGVSRLWTGTLASVAIVAWGYPRYDALLARTRAIVRRVRARDAAAASATRSASADLRRVV